MLKLNFDLYKGSTTLKEWWKQVKNHFDEVQTAHNNLENNMTEKITEEINERKSGDSALSQNLSEESLARESADNSLSERITKEAASRLSKDNELRELLVSEQSQRSAGDSNLQTKIADEKVLRENADAAMDGEIASLKSSSHTHDNMELLCSITEDDFKVWNEKVDYSNSIEYLEETCMGLTEEIKRLYAVMEIVLYDGGMFGANEDEDTLDGGAFTDTDLMAFDCGYFEPITVGTVDGGTY